MQTIPLKQPNDETDRTDLPSETIQSGHGTDQLEQRQIIEEEAGPICNKTGTSKVGAMCKAQKVQRFQVCKNPVGFFENPVCRKICNNCRGTL